MTSNKDKRICLRERIYLQLGQMTKSDVVKHFEMENISRSTIYSIINRYKKGLLVEDLPRKGRPSKLSRNNLITLKNSAKNQLGVSQRKLANKFSVSKTCIQQNLKRLNLKYHKRLKAPKYSERQLEEIPRKCRKLCREITDKETFIILDDEKYFTFGCDKIPGNAGFYTESLEDAPEKVKFKAVEKFPKKILVWLALSSKGISQPFIGKTGGPAISKEVYIKKCLSKLVLFIKKYHKDDNYIFWPDLASSHYAKATVEWLHAHNVPFVPKDANPPNVPKARPIEDFWSILATKVYKGGWEAKSEDLLARRIKKNVKEIDLSVVQTMMRKVRGKLRKIEDSGPFSIL